MPPFRVTQGSLARTAIRNLQPQMARIARLQEDLSSGRSLHRPSDSPGGTISALRLRTGLRRNEQHGNNAADGIGWLGQADTAIQGALETLRSARNLTLQGLNGANNASAREALASEMETLRDQLLSLANTEYLDQPVFAGTSGVTAAYSSTGTYQGNAGTVARTVAEGVTVQVNLPGTSVFGPAGSDIFQVMTDLADHLRTDPTQLSGDLADLDAGFLRMQNALSTVGSRYHQIELMQARTETSKVDLSNQLSEVEGVDLAATVVDLQMQEVAYQAALGATAKVVQPSLLDFLR